MSHLPLPRAGISGKAHSYMHVTRKDLSRGEIVQQIARRQFRKAVGICRARGVTQGNNVSV